MTFRTVVVGRIGVAVVAAATLAFSGCGSSSDASSGSSPGANSSNDAARVKFAKCLRENGVDIPDNPGQGGGPPQNIDQEKMQSAMQACQKYRPGAADDVDPAQQQEFRDAFVKFSACMREQGVDVPDIGSGGPPAGGGQRIDPNDPKTKAALEACQDKLPQRGAGGPGRPGGPQ